MNKWIAGTLITTLLIPELAFASMPQVTMDEELKSVIQKVKNIIEIPAGYTEFQYDVETRKSVDEENYYSMRWFDKAEETGSVRVAADEEGHLLNYSRYEYVDKMNQQLKVSYEEGYNIAKEFMNSTLKDIAGVMKDGEYIKPSRSNSYTYIFDHYVNGIKVYDESAVIEVDKVTGNVNEFRAFEPFEGKYEDIEKPISKEEAEKNYLSEIKVPLVYKLKVNDKTQKLESFPAYVTFNYENKGIEAKTGDIINPFRDNDYRVYGGAMKEDSTMDAGAGSNKLTPEEQKAVNENKDLLTKEQAQDKVSLYFTEVKGAEIKSSQLYYDRQNERYIWDLSLERLDDEKLKDIPKEKINLAIASGDMGILPPDSYCATRASVDAKTGEIINYYNYTMNGGAEPQISYEEAKKEVEKFLITIAPDKFKQTKLKEQSNQPEIWAKTAEKELNYSFTYERIVNGVPVVDNSLNVTYNTDKKSISKYYNNWSNISFKSLKKVISSEEAVQKLGLELMYVAKDAKTKVPAYMCPDTSITIDPFTGNRINSYDGTPYIAENTKLVYVDVKGHEIEPIVKALYDRGIALEGKYFKPNEAITQIDFLRLLMGRTNISVQEKDLYEQAIRRGILTKEEKAPNEQVTVTQMAHYVINYLGYNKVAELKDIYNSNLIKSNIEDADRGYLTLAYGLGIVDKQMLDIADSNKGLTRAQSAKVIYAVLQHSEIK